jgi:hypothetical protein
MVPVIVSLTGVVPKNIYKNIEYLQFNRNTHTHTYIYICTHSVTKISYIDTTAIVRRFFNDLYVSVIYMRYN